MRSREDLLRSAQDCIVTAEAYVGRDPSSVQGCATLALACIQLAEAQCNKRGPTPYTPTYSTYEIGQAVRHQLEQTAGIAPGIMNDFVMGVIDRLRGDK